MQQWIKDFFSIDDNTFATIAITLFTFILGYVITFLAWKTYTLSVRSTNRQLFIGMLESLEKSLATQAKNLSKFISGIEDKDERAELQFLNFHQQLYFTEIGYKESSDSFFKTTRYFFNIGIKRAKENFTEAWASINAIQENKMVMQKDYDVFIEKMESLTAKRNVLIGDLNNLKLKTPSFSQNRFDADYDPDQDKYFDRLNLIFEDWGGLDYQEKMSWGKIEKELIGKISELQEMASFEDSAISKEIHFKNLELAESIEQKDQFLSVSFKKFFRHYVKFKRLKEAVTESIVVLK